METNDYINLLRKINQLKEARYSEAEQQRDYGIDQSKLKPWQFVAGGDIHDRPGGEEAWNKQEEERKAKEAANAPAPKLSAPHTGDLKSHVETNAFGLSKENHEKALTILKKHGESEKLHDHLVNGGVDPNHPHMKKLEGEMRDHYDELHRERLAKHTY